MEIRNKTALITGGAKRIGKDIALGLANERCNLVIHYNSSEKEADNLINQLKKFNIKVYKVKANLFDEDEIKLLVEKTLNLVESVDILINNASIYYKTPLESTNFEDLDKFYSIHVKAPFFLSKELGKIMYAKKEGRIINIIDYAAILPYPDYIAYCTSKGAMVTMTKAFAKEFAPYVLVNGILPGPIIPPEDINDLETPLKKTVLKKWAGGKEVFKAVKYLIESDFTTGALIPVEGGRLIF